MEWKLTMFINYYHYQFFFFSNMNRHLSLPQRIIIDFSVVTLLCSCRIFLLRIRSVERWLIIEGNKNGRATTPVIKSAEKPDSDPFNKIGQVFRVYSNRVKPSNILNIVLKQLCLKNFEVPT